jgi:valyl-tRNA synthetase
LEGRTGYKTRETPTCDFGISKSNQILQEQAATIALLARLDPGSLKISEVLESKPEGHVVLVVGEIEIYLPQVEIGDRSEERTRLESELAEARVQVQRLESLLAGPFAQKAPTDIVQKEQDKLAAFRQTAEKLQAKVKELETM